MPIPSPLGTQKGADYITHPADHSEYLLGYRTATGISFAIGRTARSGARIRMSANDRFESLDRRGGFHVLEPKALPIPAKAAVGMTGTHGVVRLEC